MDSKRRFSSYIFHEVRVPLNTARTSPSLALSVARRILTSRSPLSARRPEPRMVQRFRQVQRASSRVRCSRRFAADDVASTQREFFFHVIPLESSLTRWWLAGRPRLFSNGERRLLIGLASVLVPQRHAINLWTSQARRIGARTRTRDVPRSPHRRSGKEGRFPCGGVPGGHRGGRRIRDGRRDAVEARYVAALLAQSRSSH